MKKAVKIKKPVRIVAALAVIIAIVAMTSCFAACGDRQYIITLIDGKVNGKEVVIDTVLTNRDGFIIVTDSLTATLSPAKPGYNFSGWYTREDLNPDSKIKSFEDWRFWGNSKLYCGWISLQYTVTFDLNGGMFADDEPSNDASDSTDTLPRPAKDITVTDPVTPTPDADGNYTLKVNSGDILNITSPTREHYDFDNWVCNNSEVDVTKPFEFAADVTFIAQWRAHRSTITYDPDGGIVYDNDGKAVTGSQKRQYVSYDSAFTPFTAVKTGYTFNGWFDSKDFELVANGKWQTEENYSVTAKYSPNDYSVTIQLSGGGYVTEKVTFDASYDISNYENVPSGYIFDCWEYNLNNEAGTIPSKGVWKVAGNVTLTPRYKANDYKLTLIVDTQVFGSLTVSYGGEVELPADPTESGKKFAGWFSTVNGTGERLLPNDYWRWSGDKTFYARFLAEADAVPFTVNYYLEKADYTSDTVAGKYDDNLESYTAYGSVGEKISVDTSGFGNKFENFGFDPSDELNAVTETTLSSNENILNLYFKRNTVTYLFMDGSEIVRSRGFRVGESITLANITSKKGYELTGWRISMTETVIPADDANYKAANSDVVMFAVWQIKTYSVSIDGKYVFGVEYNAKLTSEMKAAMMLADTADNTFDGLDAMGKRFTRDEIAEMNVWTIDSGIKNADGTYRLNMISLWQARKAYYTVEIYFEGEDGIFTYSEEASFMKRDVIGATVTYDENKNIITEMTLDGVDYVYDAVNTDNLLETTVAADNSAVIKLYYKRVTITPSA